MPCDALRTPQHLTVQGCAWKVIPSSHQALTCLACVRRTTPSITTTWPSLHLVGASSVSLDKFCRGRTRAGCLAVWRCTSHPQVMNVPTVLNADANMDTSGAWFVPTVDVTHDDDDALSHMSDVPLQRPASAHFPLNTSALATLSPARSDAVRNVHSLQEQYDRFKANELLTRRLTSILHRFQEEKLYRNSQIAIGWSDEHRLYLNSLHILTCPTSRCSVQQVHISRWTLQHWPRSHQQGATPCEIFTVFNRDQIKQDWDQIKQDWILGIDRILKVYLQFLDLEKRFNWLHNEPEKLCMISAKRLDVHSSLNKRNF